MPRITKKQTEDIYRMKRCTGAVIARLRAVMAGETIGKGRVPPFGADMGLVVLSKPGPRGQLTWAKVTPLGKALVAYDDSLPER